MPRLAQQTYRNDHSNGSIRVCHLTSVHKQDDIRVFRKQLVSLGRAGYETYLVSEGESGIRDGVQLIGLGNIPDSRLKRMLFFTRSVYRAGRHVDADIYQIHDPELLPIALKLKRKGKIVVFDSHENVSGQIAEKTWLPAWLRRLVATCYGSYEKRVVKRLDAVICVSPNFTERMSRINPTSVTVTNYPILAERLQEGPGNDPTDHSAELKSELPGRSDRRLFTICFPGLISEEWCHLEILDALAQLNRSAKQTDPADGQPASGEHDRMVRYIICGPVHEEYLNEMKSHPAWQYVDYVGIVSRERVARIIRESDAGMALARKCANTDEQIGTLGNTKLFEYMLQEKALIGTDFVLWKPIVEGERCGLTVEPTDSTRIAEAIRTLMDQPDVRLEMGRNGLKAVLDKYNWSRQEDILLNLYRQLSATNKVNRNRSSEEAIQ